MSGEYNNVGLNFWQEKAKEKQIALFAINLGIFPSRTWEEAKEIYFAGFKGSKERDFFIQENEDKLVLGLKRGESPIGILERDLILYAVFDKNGRYVKDYNTIGHTINTFEYNQAGRLVSQEKVSSSHGESWKYEYNQQGRLVKVQVQFWTRNHKQGRQNWGEKLVMEKRD